MGRIKVNYHGKEYIIEYANRIEVKNYFVELSKLDKTDDFENSIKSLVLLIKAGLVKNHSHEMPSDDDIANWVVSMPKAQEFYKKLMSMVQEVVNVIENDTKNLAWEEVD